MSIVTVQGIQLYYETHGQGEPVVLLNGIMQNTAGWSAQTQALSKHYQVILHDMRGQGKSDKPAMDYTWDMHVEDLKALLDHLKLDRVHIIGVSYGAETAMFFAIKYPEMVKSLVLGTAVSELDPLLKATAESWEVASHLHDGYKFFKLFSPSIYGNTFYQAQGNWLEKRAHEFGASVPVEWFEGFERLLKNFYTLNVTDRLHTIKAPTLILVAEKDTLKPLPFSYIIKKEIPHAEMLIIADSGHVSLFEKPEEFNTAILGFLAKQ